MYSLALLHTNLHLRKELQTVIPIQLLQKLDIHQPAIYVRLSDQCKEHKSFFFKATFYDMITSFLSFKLEKL